MSQMPPPSGLPDVSSENGVQYAPSEDAQTIRPLALLNMLLRRRWTVLLVTGVLVLAAVAWVLLAQPSYTSTAKFLLSQSRSLTSRMGSMAGPGSDLTVGEDTSSADYYIALMQSPAFLERILMRPFHVEALGRQETLLAMLSTEGDTGRQSILKCCVVLSGRIRASAAKAAAGSTGPRIITLTVDAPEPQLSADIAKAVLEEVMEYNQTARNSKAAETRKFVQKQLDEAAVALENASQALANFMGRNRKIATPAVQAEKDRLERQRRVQEEVFITLTKQLELARIEEQENRVSIEVLQPPEPPTVRTSPRRTSTVLQAGLLGLMLGCLAAFAMDRVSELNHEDPDTRDLLENLRAIRKDARRLIPFGGQ
jgi:uncharacterized protein involved in exopolysaccharide biosynthesis